MVNNAPYAMSIKHTSVNWSATSVHVTADTAPCAFVTALITGKRANIGANIHKENCKTGFTPKRSTIGEKKKPWKSPSQRPNIPSTAPMRGGSNPSPPSLIGVAQKRGKRAENMTSMKPSKE